MTVRSDILLSFRKGLKQMSLSLIHEETIGSFWKLHTEKGNQNIS